MTRGGSRPRTLLVGPLGPRPWISRNELVAQLEDLGHEVIVNGGGGAAELVPALEPLPSRVGVARNSLPSLLAWLVRMLWRWRHATRAALRDAKIDHVLVWDPVLAGLCRLARPSGTEVTWVASKSDSGRFYERLLRTLLATTADRVVVSWTEDARWVRGRVTLNHWPRPAPSEWPTVDEWVVLGSEVAPTDDAIARLRHEASVEPAAAVVFDIRDDARVSPALTERLRAASGAAHVWWAADDEWLAWLGGSPRHAFDPSQTLTVDQRHVRVLSDGGSLHAPADADASPSLQLVQPIKTRDGWTQHALREDLAVPTGETEWATNVFGPQVRTLGERLAEHGVPVSLCPMCSSPDRRLAGRAEDEISIMQCRSCGLRYASHVLAPTDLDQSQPGDAIVSRVIDDRLDALEGLDIPIGRLLDVRDPHTSIDSRAVERGWDVHELAAGDLESTTDLGTFDVVMFGQSLESMPHPVRTLRVVRERFIETGGYVLIETANARSVSRYLQRRHWTHWRAGERVAYPDPWTIRQMLQRAGFQTRLLRSISHADVPATGGELARQLGLVSDRLIQVLPPVRSALDRLALDRVQRAAVRWIDDRGYGLNVIAVGRAI